MKCKAKLLKRKTRLGRRQTVTHASKEQKQKMFVKKERQRENLPASVGIFAGFMWHRRRNSSHGDCESAPSFQRTILFQQHFERGFP